MAKNMFPRFYNPIRFKKNKMNISDVTLEKAIKYIHNYVHENGVQLERIFISHEEISCEYSVCIDVYYIENNTTLCECIHIVETDNLEIANAFIRNFYIDLVVEFYNYSYYVAIDCEQSKYSLV